MTATMAEISEEASINPDAQSAVTDFLDYTEYLPADLIRSLSLIRHLDETYLDNAEHVDKLAKVYGKLPSLPVGDRPDPLTLRSDISRHLDLAISARESAYAEALRLFGLTDRHQDRLKSIIAKLTALPKPPSRDPTPQPQTYPLVKRARSGRKLDNGITRLTLKAPKDSAGGPTSSRPRNRRVTVPGEVLPPFDPDEPIASTEVSDWESPPSSPVPPALEVPQSKQPKHKSTADSERKTREPRESTAYYKPTPPPDDASLGSKHRPWTHLTEYEMYKLRKKMKKNHTWEPSEVMIRRELAEKGRGWENYWKAKAAAKENGAPFIAIDSIDRGTSVSAGKTEPAKSTPKTEVPTRPKSLKRTESKKDKREDTPRDAASIAAQEAEFAARRLGSIGSAFKHLFSPLVSALATVTPSTPSATTPGKANGKPPKKRKLEETVSASPSAEPEVQQKKKQKLLPKPSPLTGNEASTTPVPSAGTIKIPLKLNLSGTQQTTTSANSASVATSQLTNVPSAPTKSEPTPPPSRPPSRRSAAASVEPSAILSGRPGRRASNSLTPAPRKTPAPESTPKTIVTAASRRTKREAPGTVTQSSQDGGAAVSISKRKTKPSKVTKAQAQKAVDAVKPQLRTDIDGNQELVDPDEERYCICDDVSWGEMICCELDEKCQFGQWFHMDCVQLHDLPPRTVKWYCPEDRKRLRKGENSNGLVGRGIK